MKKAREQQIADTLRELADSLPKLPDGRIDYSHANRAAVLTCIVRYRGKILLLKRSNKVHSYQGKWCGVAGYLDELRPYDEMVYQELREELGIRQEDVETLTYGEPYEFTDDQTGKTWVVFPVLADMKSAPNIEIDWEHVDFEWVEPERIDEFDTVPRLKESLKRVLPA